MNIWKEPCSPHPALQVAYARHRHHVAARGCECVPCELQQGSERCGRILLLLFLPFVCSSLPSRDPQGYPMSNARSHPGCIAPCACRRRKPGTGCPPSEPYSDELRFLDSGCLGGARRHRGEEREGGGEEFEGIPCTEWLGRAVSAESRQRFHGQGRGSTRVHRSGQLVACMEESCSAEQTVRTTLGKCYGCSIASWSLCLSTCTTSQGVRVVRQARSWMQLRLGRETRRRGEACELNGRRVSNHRAGAGVQLEERQSA